MKVFVVLILIITVLKHDVDSAEPGDWNYEVQTSWPGECSSGKQQSPINIETAKAVRDEFGVHIRGPLQFNDYDSVNLTAFNTGKTLEWELSPNSMAPTISGGPLRSNYTFAQFHLHWFSEHAIDGLKFPLEIHFVHVMSGLTLAQALTRPDGLAVMSTLCEVHSATNGRSSLKREYYALEEIIAQVPDLLMSNNGQRIPPRKIDMTRLFSSKPQKYYTYHGSLTTPNCNEVVTWIVMDTPIIIADTQLQQIHKANIGGSDNFRQLQPTNRVVYRSNGTSYPPNILFLITTVLAWLAGEIKKGICAIINKKKMFFGETKKNCMEFAIKY